MPYKRDYTPTHHVALTEHDTTRQPQVVAIYVGTAGSLVMTDDADTECTYSNVPAGAIIPFTPKLIKTGSTAGGLVGLY